MSGQAKFEIYPQVTPARDQVEGEELVEPTGEFGWRFKSANGQISAIGGEGFTRREDARRAVSDFISAIIDDPRGFASAAKPFPSIIDVDLDGTEDAERGIEAAKRAAAEADSQG